MRKGNAHQCCREVPLPVHCLIVDFCEWLQNVWLRLVVDGRCSARASPADQTATLVTLSSDSGDELCEPDG